MVVLLSFEWSVDWTDRFILKGGIGIFYIFFEIGFCAKIKEFRFFGLGIHCGLQNFPFFSIWFSVFVKNTCLMGYGFGFRWSFWIVLFGFRFLFDPSGHYAPLRLHWSRIAAKPLYAPLVNTVADRLEFWELGCEHLLVLTVLHAVFGSSRIFFAVLRLWMIFSTALRFLIDPLILPHVVEFQTDSCFANWKSLFLKLQIFPFVLFRVLN